VGYTTLSQIILVYLHLFSSCCPPNLRNPAKILRKFELTAVQGHSRSSILVPVESACNFLLSLIVPLDYLLPFPRYWRILLENSLFSLPHAVTLVWRSLAEERSAIAYQCNVYIAEKYIMGYIIRSLTILVYLHSAKSREIPRAFELSSSMSSKVTDLGVNWRRICNFLLDLVINSNFVRTQDSYCFRDIEV